MAEEPPEASDPRRASADRADSRSRLTGYLRLALGLGLLVLLVSWVDFAEVGRALRQVAYLWVAGALAANLLFEGVCVLKLYLLGRALMADLTFGVALRAYLVGAFFSNFLPTNVGGDVVKVGMLARAGGRWSAATAAVVLERASGIAALYCLALVAALPPFGVLEIFGLAGVRWVILGAGVAAPLVLFFLFVGGLKRLEEVLEGRSGNRFARFFRRLVASFLLYQSRKGLLAAAFGLSVAFQLLRCLAFYLLARSVSVVFGLAPLVGAIAIVTVISFIPVSVGALGLREGAITYTFSRMGMAAPQALAIALIARLLSYVKALAGGLLYTLGAGAGRPVTASPEE